MAKYFITPIVIFLIAVAAASFAIGNTNVFEWEKFTREKILAFTGLITLVCYFGYLIKDKNDDTED